MAFEEEQQLVRTYLKQAGDVVGQPVPDDIPDAVLEFCAEMIRAVRREALEEATAVASRVVARYDRLCKDSDAPSPSEYGLFCGASEVTRQLLAIPDEM
jgi:hypothetical protein